MKKQKKIMYLNTYCEGGYCYDDFVDYCKEQNWDMQEDELEDSRKYWEWINRQIELDVDCFFTNLQYCDAGKIPVVISGQLGLWWGKPQIENEMCENLGEAVKKCWGDCNDVQVWLKNGVVYVVAMHHDGRNCFEIRPLTKRGEEKMREGEEICVGNHWHTGKWPEYLY